MRIFWNDENDWFQAEITLSNDDWRDDVEHAKASGFKTTGSPMWIWHTNKISVLESLRGNRPKSGLIITEQALEKYNFLKGQADRKQELKKIFKKELQSAQKSQSDKDCREYEDPNTGMVCIYVEPSKEVFTGGYIPPPKPNTWCFVCGETTYEPIDYSDVCLWCSKVNSTDMGII